MSHITLYIVGWAVLAIVVAVLAVYRYALVRHEDKSLNILESSAVASEQTRAFKKANRIQRIGIPLTLVVVVYGLTLAGVYFHQLWVAAGQIPR
jgi:hypothetical protein